jgi:hypothetical protein
MNENSPNPNLNETDLLEFALRLATYPGDSRTQKAQLLPGQLPDQLPVDIPFPEGSRVLGSLISNPESINMFLDTHLSPEQVLTFYRQRMEALGWQTTDIFQPNRGGLMPTGARSRGGNETFYKGLRDPSLTVNGLGISSAWVDEFNRNRSGPVLTVNAYPGKGSTTDLRLNLNMNGPFPPGPPRHMRGLPSRNIVSLLPALEAPEGSNMTGGGSGGSLNGAHSEITIETNIDLSTLAVHYKTQLEQAGCVLTEEGQNGSLAWITWTLKEDDELWHGFFFILKELDQEYYLNMRMKSDKGGKTTTER